MVHSIETTCSREVTYKIHQFDLLTLKTNHQTSSCNTHRKFYGYIDRKKCLIKYQIDIVGEFSDETRTNYPCIHKINTPTFVASSLCIFFAESINNETWSTTDIYNNTLHL